MGRYKILPVLRIRYGYRYHTGGYRYFIFILFLIPAGTGFKKLNTGNLSDNTVKPVLKLKKFLNKHFNIIYLKK